MGFLDMFRKREKPPPPSMPVEVPPERVVSNCRAALSRELEESVEKSHSFQSRLRSLFNGLPLQPLEKAAFQKSDRRYAAVNMLKDSYVKRMKSLASNLPEPGTAYPEVQGFREAASSILAEMKKATPKQAFSISTYFKEESRPVVERMKEIDSLLHSFREFLDQENAMASLHYLGKEAAGFKGLLEKRSALEKERQSALKEASLASVKKQAVERSLENLLSGSEWKAMSSLRSEIASLEQKAAEIRQEASEVLSALKRPLKKAAHASGGSGLKQLLSPVDALFSEGEHPIRKALENIRSLESRGSISLKGSESQKLLRLEDLLSSGKLSELKQEHARLLTSARKRQEQADHSLPARKAGLESEAASLASRASSLREQSAEAARALETLEPEIASKKMVLETLALKNTGRQIRIV